VILLEATNEWIHLRLQDYKSIKDYNHVIHKICAKLCFYENEPSEVDKIEKTLQTMLPSDRILQHQYRTKHYQYYSDFIHDLLQANDHQRSIGTAPLPEVHYNVKGKGKVDGSNNHQKNFDQFMKGKRNGKGKKSKTKGKGKGKTFKCHMIVG
jgi:hypothetical protein